MKNLEELLLNMVDVGMVVKDVANGSYFSALRKGISLAGNLPKSINWKACGEELLSLTNEEKAALQQSLSTKLKAVNDEKVEKKIVEGLGLLIEAVDYAEEGVGVGKKLSQFIKEV